MTHGECLEELWDASRSVATRRSDFISLAHHCMEQAAAGVPCVLRGMPDYPAVKYTAALWSEPSVELMTKVFAAYVQHGYIDPNAVLVADDELRDSHYRKLSGLLPLAASASKGNLHTAEQLVLHGAKTDIVVAGMDFFTFVRVNYGNDVLAGPKPEVREAAAARLMQAAMARRIASTQAPVIEPVMRRRRAQL